MSAKPKSKNEKITKEDPAEQVEEALTESEALEIENAHLKVQLAHAQLEAVSNARAAIAARIVAAHPRDGYEPQDIDIAQRKILMRRKATA